MCGGGGFCAALPAAAAPVIITLAAASRTPTPTTTRKNQKVIIDAPYAHLDIPAIVRFFSVGAAARTPNAQSKRQPQILPPHTQKQGQAYLLFRARLAPPYAYGPGPESLDVRLFAPDDIPWAEVI